MRVVGAALDQGKTLRQLARPRHGRGGRPGLGRIGVAIRRELGVEAVEGPERVGQGLRVAHPRRQPGEGQEPLLEIEGAQRVGHFHAGSAELIREGQHRQPQRVGGIVEGLLRERPVDRHAPNRIRIGRLPAHWVPVFAGHARGLLVSTRTTQSREVHGEVVRSRLGGPGGAGHLHRDVVRHVGLAQLLADAALEPHRDVCQGRVIVDGDVERRLVTDGRFHQGGDGATNGGGPESVDRHRHRRARDVGVPRLPRCTRVAPRRTDGLAAKGRADLRPEVRLADAERLAQDPLVEPIDGEGVGAGDGQVSEVHLVVGADLVANERDQVCPELLGPEAHVEQPAKEPVFAVVPGPHRLEQVLSACRLRHVVEFPQPLSPLSCPCGNDGLGAREVDAGAVVAPCLTRTPDALDPRGGRFPPVAS